MSAGSKLVAAIIGFFLLMFAGLGGLGEDQADGRNPATAKVEDFDSRGLGRSIGDTFRFPNFVEAPADNGGQTDNAEGGDQ